MANNVSSLEEVDKVVKEAVVDVGRVNIEQVIDEANIIDDLGFDSLDTVELMMKIEEKFNIQTDEIDSDQLKTVGQIKKAVAEKLGIKS